MIDEISVVIPTFNRAASVTRALTSVASQTWTGTLEVIVTDNASSDGTVAAVQAWQSDNPDVPVTVIGHETNLGPVANWRAGISAAAAPWVKVVWSDDLLLPNALQDLTGALADDQAAVSVGAGILRTSQGQGVIQNDGPSGTFTAEDFTRSWLRREGRYSQSATAALVRRDLALEGLAASESLGECASRGVGPDMMLLYWAVFRGFTGVHTGTTVCEYRADAQEHGDTPSITSTTSGTDLRVCYDAALARLVSASPAPIPADLVAELRHRSFEAHLVRHRLAELLLSPKPSATGTVRSIRRRGRRLWPR